MGIYEIENETALVLKIIPWKNGQINFPSLEIGENKIEIPSVEVSSILEVTGEQTLQSTLPPFAVPGTSYVFYGLILFLIVLLLFLSMLIFKFSTVKNFVDFIFRNKYSRHYKKTMRKIVALKKNMEKLSNKDFAKELLEIARYYLQGYLKQDLSSFTSTEIKTRLYFFMEELEKEYEKKHTDISAFYTGVSDSRINNLLYNFIKDMSIDELTDGLDKYGQFDSSPWMGWFDENYCSKCESIKCKVDEKDAFWPDYTMDCAYCELENKCKYFPQLDNIPDNKDTIKLWLMQKHEEKLL